MKRHGRRGVRPAPEPGHHEIRHDAEQGDEQIPADPVQRHHSRAGLGRLDARPRFQHQPNIKAAQEYKGHPKRNTRRSRKHKILGLNWRRREPAANYWTSSEGNLFLDDVARASACRVGTRADAWLAKSPKSAAVKPCPMSSAHLRPSPRAYRRDRCRMGSEHATTLSSAA